MSSSSVSFDAMSRDYVQIARRFAAAPWVLALPVGVFVAAAVLWGLGLDSEGAGVTAIAATVFTIWVALRSESRAADRHHQQSHMELRELRYGSFATGEPRNSSISARRVILSANTSSSNTRTMI